MAEQFFTGAGQGAAARRVALAGMVALAVAMGIGRFAFTPILPMMLQAGRIDLPAASWLASANYLGYLLGAAVCTLQPWLWARLPGLPLLPYAYLVRAGLLATGGLTLAMAWNQPAAWPLLRFAAGVTSAIVFVYTSGWCLSRLAGLGRPAMGGFIYTGPGVGIVVSGLLASAITALHGGPATGWLILGVLAFGLAALAWRGLDGPHGASERLHRLTAATPLAPGQNAESLRPLEMPVLALAYSLAGFGYIITATFLPVIARTALPGSGWLDLFWPVFGIGIVSGALLATRLPAHGDRRLRLAGCYAVQALGIAVSLWFPTMAGFALGSFLLGLPFTAITFFAIQEVRRLRPATAAAFIGLLTAGYGIGQFLGPPLVAWLLQRTGNAGEGFSLALEIAAAALLLGTALYLGLARAYPAALVAPVMLERSAESQVSGAEADR